MKRPRITVRTMIYLVLVVALDCAWAPNIWRMRSLIGFGWHCLDLPVLGTANVLAAAGYPLLSRRRGRPFLAGFVVAGLVLMAGYVGRLRADPEGSARKVSDYLLAFQNRFVEYFPLNDSHLSEAGYVWRYVPLDALLTLAGSLPMLAVAALVGLLAWGVARLRAWAGGPANPAGPPGTRPASGG